MEKHDTHDAAHGALPAPEAVPDEPDMFEFDGIRHPSQEEWAAWATENLAPEEAAVFQAPPSTIVAVCDARGFWVRKLDCGPGGRDFPCRMVTWEDDFAPLPWPIEDVEPLSEHPEALTRDQYNEAYR